MAGLTAQWGGYDMGPGMMGGWGMGYGMGWFGMIISLAFWILIIIGLVFLIRWLAISVRDGGVRGHGNIDTPLDILKKRYVKGEISKEEYETIKKDIS
jgi:putative membrane protein